ncbi:hypothetical protein QZH41_010761 [Actinostola sp. cb2023]|nr:hypothetical protein QZH41_010761 [Actinostola sp. cb2023]
MDEDLKHVITEEERTRHDALFYSQTPKKGFLSGEQARSLFIRSRLPLSELSKIWKLADITRDNMLDVSEFATAMHLIQLRLRGFEIPEKLPPSLAPSSVHKQITTIPQITEQDMNVYQKTFEWKDNNKTGFIDTDASCSIMLSSKLEPHVLARIWDLSDIDRDAKLCASEFAIVLHLLRFCKKGIKAMGYCDLILVYYFNDIRVFDDLFTEVLYLCCMQQKLCSEMTGGLDEEIVNEKIRPELNKVEEKLFALEKEETELRRGLLNLKDKSKKESFKPFDRSFLLKKRVCGSDLFKGDRQTYLGKDSVVFEKLWTADELEFGEYRSSLVYNIVSTKEEEDRPTSSYNGLSNDSSQTQPTDIVFSEVKRDSKAANDTRELSNGVDSRVDNSIDSGRLDSSARLISTREASSSTSRSNQTETRNTDLITKDRQKETQESTGSTEGKKVERNDSFSWAAVKRRPVICQTVSEEVIDMPEKKGEVVEEFVSVEHKDSGSKTTELDEQLKLLEKDSSDHVDINQNSGPLIEAEVTVESVKRVESAAHQDLDIVFDELPEVNHSAVNGTDSVNNVEKTGSTKLPVGRVLSNEEEKELIESGALKRAERDVHPRNQPTQEELLPMFLEEKRKLEEERRNKREIDEEKIRQAREELKRQEEENKEQLMMRKAAIQEAKGILERQISQTELSVPRSDGGRLIEHEFEEQRIREDEARQRMEQFKRQPLNQPKPTEGGSKVHPKQIYIESIPTEESKPHFNPPVVRRQKPEQKKRSNRKSWVELEIEQQKVKDEEMRREREERQQELDRLGQGQRHFHSIQRDIEIPEQPIVSSGVNVVQASQFFSTPPANKGAGVSTKEVNKPSESSRVPENVPKSSIHSVQKIPSSARASDVRDAVDGNMTAEEIEIEMKIQEEEERRRLEQIEQVRLDCLRREAEELVRGKQIREEELRKKREIQLKEAEKRKKEEQERQVDSLRNAEHRRLNFVAEKVRLEERVIRTMKESHMQSDTTTVRTSSVSNAQQPVASPPPSDNGEVRERRSSVRDAKALFERPTVTQEQPKVVMRQKRQSLNLDDTPSVVKPHKKDNRASFHSDTVMTQHCHSKSTNEIQIIHMDEAPDEKPTRLALGDIAQKRQQFETRQRSVESRQPVSAQSQSQSPRVTGHKDQSAADTGSFFPSIKNNRIQKEMQELKQKEEEIRLRRKGLERASSSEQDSLDGIKKNPLPSKMQVSVYKIFNCSFSYLS